MTIPAGFMLGQPTYKLHGSWRQTPKTIQWDNTQLTFLDSDLGLKLMHSLNYLLIGNIHCQWWLISRVWSSKSNSNVCKGLSVLFPGLRNSDTNVQTFPSFHQWNLLLCFSLQCVTNGLQNIHSDGVFIIAEDFNNVNLGLCFPNYFTWYSHQR